MYRKFIPLTLVVLLALCVSVFAQGKLPDLGIQKEKNLAVGVVKSVEEKKVVLETKDGMLDVILISQTTYKRMSPDKLSLKAAQDATFADVAVGDRVLVTGKISFDSKNIITKTVYLVKGADIKAIEDKEKREWQTRGVTGRVKAVDAVAKEITVEMRGITGSVTTLKVTPKEQIKYLRYSPTSVKYRDAVASEFTTIQAGDMLRALGDRSADQQSFKAEQILTGAFVTVSGTVKAIDAEKNEITITDLKTKKDVTIAVNDDSLLKKFPLETAERLARMQLMMKMRASGVQPPRARNRSGATQTGGKEESKNTKSTDAKKRGEAGERTGARRGGGQRRGGRAGRRGMRGGDINEMINRFPTIKVTDLKVGDMIAASSPKGKDPNRLTAIKLLAGVEPFVKAAQIPTRRGGRGGSRGSGLTIPGLDGPSF